MYRKFKATINGPTVIHKDAIGVPITYIEVDGKLYARRDGVRQEANIRASHETVARDDDVILVNFPKSGSNWVNKILHLLLKRKTTSNSVSKFLLEEHSQQEVTSLQSPRILNSHFRFNELPADGLKKRTKVVLVQRNPKDIAAALYEHIRGNEATYQYSGQWEHWLQLFLYGHIDGGCWVEYVLDWQKVISENQGYPIHLVRYEDLKENLGREVTKLAKFLGVKVTPEVLSSVVEQCELPALSESRDQQPYALGDVGYWKTKFTLAQNELFDQLFAKRTANSGLKIRFEL